MHNAMMHVTTKVRRFDGTVVNVALRDPWPLVSSGVTSHSRGERLLGKGRDFSYPRRRR